MPRAWSGATPVNIQDSNAYELGTEQRANQTVTLTRLWVWGDNRTFNGRVGHIWNPINGQVVASVPLPADLPAGWTGYDLPAPIVRDVSQRWVAAYGTLGDYGSVPHGMDVDVVSMDGAVTTLATTNGTNGNGVFRTEIGSFPNQSFNSTFYGVDVEYELGTGDLHPPVITGVAIDTDELSATLTITVTDADGLAGLTYSVEWGDGASSSGSSATLSHAYAEDGLWPVLVSVADPSGLSDYLAVVVVVAAPVPLTGDPVVMPLARELLGCYEEELAKLVSPPQYVGLRPGTGVDFLLSTSEDECCAGLAWVRPVAFYPSSAGFPNQDTTAQKQGTRAWAIVLEMGIVTCAPTPDADSIPTNAEWDAVTQTVMDASAAMRRAICCWIDLDPVNRKQKILPGQWTPVAVQGGCVGGALQVTIMGPACDCTEAGQTSS